MKALLITLLSFLTLNVFSQQATMNSVQDLGLIQGSDNELPANLKNDQYFSIDFEKASVNSIKEPAYLRYNLYKDEMEFLKSNKIYFLRKSTGSKIDFVNANKSYGVFNLNNKLQYFRVIKQDKVSLLVKEKIRFIQAKPAATSYDTDKPAKFDREDDQYYLSFDGKNTIEIPRRKNDFYDLFGKDGSTVKNYMKKNRLRHKSIEDLEKTISFYNTL